MNPGSLEFWFYEESGCMAERVQFVLHIICVCHPLVRLQLPHYTFPRKTVMLRAQNEHTA
jgi:hypothetical protein